MDAFTLAAKLVLDSSEFDSGLGEKEGVFKQFGQRLGGFAAGAGKAVGVAIGAAATAVTAITKQAVEAYANYEQLVGGVETLFGAGGQSLEEYAESVGKSVGDAEKAFNKLMEAQETVFKNADEAWKNAGLSANEYMETVTSFSAALIQGLGGDSAKAAQVANQAIIDMSDNANKMGTAMEDIQRAYQGFAKQNFTMLDNLKLGYGGTKTEMERLLADAEKLTGIKYDINNFADIIEAIHVIQTELGITGTTAKEASTTITGSFNAVKAAWKNLLVEFGKDNADIAGKIDILVGAAETAFNNVMPVIERSLLGIATFVEKISPTIAQKLPGMVSDILPKLLNAATTIVGGVIKALPSLITTLFNAIKQINWKQLGTDIWSAIKTAFNELSTWFTDIFTKAKNAIKNINWQEVGQTIREKLVNAFETAKEFIKSINWADVAEGIKTQISTAFGGFDQLFTGLFGDGWDTFKSKFTELLPVLSSVVSGVLAFKTAISIGHIISTVTSAVSGLFAVLAAHPFALVIAGVAALGAALVTAYDNVEWFRDAVDSAWDSIKTAFGNVSDWFAEKFAAARESIANGDSWNIVGSNIIDGISNGLSDIVGRLTEKFNDAKAAIQAINWSDVGHNIWDTVSSALSDIGSKLSELFTQGKDAVMSIDWAGLGTSILDTVKAGFSAVGEVFGSIFEDAKAAIGEIDWASVGNEIGEFITSKIDGIRDKFTEVFQGAADAIKTVDWTSVGSDIRGFIEGAFSDISSFFTGLFSQSMTDVQAMDWLNFGASLLDLVQSGLEGFDDLFTGLFGDGWANFKKEIEGISSGVEEAFGAMGEIVNGIGDGISTAFNGVVSAVASAVGWIDAAINKVKEFFGFSDKARQEYEQQMAEAAQAADDFINTMNSKDPAVISAYFDDYATEDIQYAKEIFEDILQYNGDETKIASTFTDNSSTRIAEALQYIDDLLQHQGLNIQTLSEHIDGTSEPALIAIARLQELYNESQVDYTSFSKHVSEVPGLVSTIIAWLTELSGYQGLISDTTSRHTNETINITYTQDGGKLPPLNGGNADPNMNVLNAIAMSPGRILRGATMFGWDAFGNPQIGGEVGAEAVVGVNSLDQMIQNSVNAAMSAVLGRLDALISGRSDRPLKVVLDTGALVGGIVDAMDSEMDTIAQWKAGDRA